MGVIGVILLVAFVIICILLVCLVLIQNEEGGGFGGLFGGGGSQAFGSRSGNVLTKTTYILVALFFLSSFGLALLNKTPVTKGLEGAVQQTQEAAGSPEWWQEPGSNTDPAQIAPAEAAPSEAAAAEAAPSEATPSDAAPAGN